MVSGWSDWGLSDKGLFDKRTKWSMAELVKDQMLEDEMAKDEIVEDEVDINRFTIGGTTPQPKTMSMFCALSQNYNTFWENKYTSCSKLIKDLKNSIKI